MEKCLAELRCNLCSCAFKNGVFDAAAYEKHLPHIETYYWILNYTTLNSEPGRRLCRVGECRQCGKLFCEGLTFPAEESGADFLLTAYCCFFLEVYFMKPKYLTNGVFRAEFVKLFHENDRPAVKAWLELS